MTDPLEDARDFIHSHIASVDHFRVLLLLHDDPDRFWESSEVVGRLRLPPPTAKEALANLASKGFLERRASDQCYRYNPRNEELAEMVVKLVNFDRERPVSLIRMIYARRTEEQAFADAFRIIKRKDT